MRILSFGHLPISYGGKQTSGASFVIYQLAKHFNELDNIDSFVCATDIYKETDTSYGITYLGWNKSLIVKKMFKHPYSTFKIFCRSIHFAKVYNLPFLPLLFKSLHLQFTLMKVKPDILQFHNYDSLAYLRIVRLYNTKVLFTKHGMSGYNEDVYNYLQCRKFEQDETNSKIDYMVFVTHNLYESWIGKYGQPKAKCYCIPNSYDETCYFFKDTTNTRDLGKIVLVTVGSVYKLKGQLRVVKAIASSENKNKIKYICIGNGKEENINLLKKEASDLAVDLDFLGPKSPQEIREILLKSDFMILPSSYEGFGLVFLESLACGVPVILPKFLPIVKEKGIINESNSILLHDESITSIKNVLDNLKPEIFIHANIASEIKVLSWDSVVKQYLKILQNE